MNIPAGIVLQLSATLAFAVMQALVRGVADEIPSGEVVFFRSFFGLIPLLLWLAMRGELRAVSTTNVPGHVLRGLIGVAAMWCGFSALAYIPLAEATALTYVTPLITVVLAALLLSERVPGHRWIAVGLGLLGIFVMMVPLFSAHGMAAEGAYLGVGFGMVNALLSAFAVIQVRRLTLTETTGAIVFYFSSVAAAVSLVTVPWWKMPNLWEGVALVSMGLLGGVGQIFLTAANRAAPASVVAPFNYATLLWAVFLGAIFFQEWPHPLVFCGAALVVASGVGIALKERHSERRSRTRAQP